MCLCVGYQLTKPRLIVWVTAETQEGQTHWAEVLSAALCALSVPPLPLSSPQVNLLAPSSREDREGGKDKELALPVGRGQ